jgi:hypothetical protein
MREVLAWGRRVVLPKNAQEPFSDVFVAHEEAAARVQTDVRTVEQAGAAADPTPLTGLNLL